MNPTPSHRPQPAPAVGPDALDNWLSRSVPMDALEDDGFSAAVMQKVAVTTQVAMQPVAANGNKQNANIAPAGIQKLATKPIAFTTHLSRTLARWLERESLPTGLLLATSLVWLMVNGGAGDVGGELTAQLLGSLNAQAALLVQPLMSVLGLVGMCWASWRYVKR